MATRANIAVLDGDATVWMYRHCDGDPGSVRPTLEFLRGIMIASTVQERAAIARPALAISGLLAAIGRIEDDSPLYRFDPAGGAATQLSVRVAASGLPGVLETVDPTGTSQCYERTDAPLGGEEWRYAVWCGPGEHYGRAAVDPWSWSSRGVEAWAADTRDLLLRGDMQRAAELRWLDEWRPAAAGPAGPAGPDGDDR